MAQGPVNYTEKGYGLHQAVFASGNRIWCENGQWLADDATAVQAIIDAYDPVPDAQSAAIAAASAQYDVRIAAGFAYEGKLYQIDTGSQADMTSMAAMAQVSIADTANHAWPVGFAWIATDNSATPMTAAALLTFSYSAGAYVAALFAQLQTLKAAIRAASTLDGVAAIDVTAGWPTSA